MLIGTDSILNQEARAAKRSGDFDLALKIYRDLLTRHGDNSDIHYNIAKVYSARNDSKPALSHYMASLHLDLIRAEKLTSIPYFDLARVLDLDYPESQKLLCRIDFRNTMVNLGKMITGMYQADSYLRPPSAEFHLLSTSVVSLSEDGEKDLILAAVHYALRHINWTKILNQDTGVAYLDSLK